jgi:hypothetical protein
VNTGEFEEDYEDEEEEEVVGQGTPDFRVAKLRTGRGTAISAKYGDSLTKVCL